MTIDIIIPIYKPGRELFALLNALRDQTLAPGRIILLNTEESYFQRLIYGTKFTSEYENVEVHHLSKKEFDHGGTRHWGTQYSDAELFVMMTQDAMPADRRLLERLTVHLSGKTAVAYARQLPRQDAADIERISRYFNYPKSSRIKSAEDLEKMGVKTFFCSNVCAAYRREIYEELGGFVRHTIFNEDMLYAAAAVKAGYQIAYEADACVIHSHNYTCMQQLHRNFDLGVSQAEHPEVFAGVSSESEGKKLIKNVYQYLKVKKRLYRFPLFCVQCFFKYTGYLLGKHYRALPRNLVWKLTANREYWT